MPHDPYGSGTISEREKAERIVREAVRRVKLEAKNDQNFGRSPTDTSGILAARHFNAAPTTPERDVNDADAIVAMRMFNGALRGDEPGTPLNIPWRVVQRDGTGRFEATEATLDSVRAHAGVTNDFVLYKPDGSTIILRVPTGTIDLEAEGKVTVVGAFGCNGKAAQVAVASPGAAGGGSGGAGGVSGSANNPYDGPTQTLINDLAAAVNAHASIINAQASQITTLATLVNTMRTALVANGILS